MEINRWWYSKQQEDASKQIHSFCERHVFVGGKWCKYTEWTISLNGKSNWEDAVLVAESTTKLPIMINGVRQ